MKLYNIMEHLLKQPDNQDDTNGDHLANNLQNIEMRTPVCKNIIKLL